jgi:hypothetical protein
MHALSLVWVRHAISREGRDDLVCACLRNNGDRIQILALPGVTPAEPEFARGIT